MDDLLKNLTFGLFALATFHAGLEQRIRHDAARQVTAMFHDTGPVQVRVEPRGMFGLVANDIWVVDIYGQHLRTERMPFSLYPRHGWKGSIRHLRLHLTDFTLAGLPIERLDADVPFVTFDIGEAAWKDRIVLRGAGTGPAVVQVGAAGLRAFLFKRYTQTLSDVEVWWQNRKLYLSGRVRLFAGPVPLIASGRLVPREGRYLDLADPVFMLNNAPVSPALAALILRQINPVLDVERDLNLGRSFQLTEAAIGDTGLILRGQATIPVAEEPSPLSHSP